MSKRFGGWKKALEKAGLQSTGYNAFVKDEDLLEEIEDVWIRLGRQPTTNDIKSGISKYGLNTYLRHFGSWRKTLEVFVNYVNTTNNEISFQKSEDIKKAVGKIGQYNHHKTKRDVNLKLRFLVMKRDGFKCRACGASPATNPLVELQIDHIIPWAKGGETVYDNLQTLCKDCNLGKSDIM